ncbi:hypothetical protein CC79DRAFT_541079 [Sarocladium strictum]
MSRLAPVEKLPLAARKDLRDNWEGRKAGLEEELTTLFGQPWTIEVNPNQIYAYAEEGYAKESPGSMISQYFEAAHRRLSSYLDKHGESAKKEINEACTAHTLTLDVNLDQDFLYNGVVITSDGKLALLFNADRLAVNIDDCIEDPKLTKALNNASASSGSAMSFVARTSIETEWNPESERITKAISEIFQTEVTIEPNFQETYDKLKAAKGEGDWEQNIGNFTRYYFDALEKALTRQKFDSDDMMREALVEAVEKNKVVFRIVEEGEMKKLYNEPAFEDGVLYLQTTTDRWGSNIDDVADGMVDLL